MAQDSGTNILRIDMACSQGDRSGDRRTMPAKTLTSADDRDVRDRYPPEVPNYARFFEAVRDRGVGELADRAPAGSHRRTMGGRLRQTITSPATLRRRPERGLAAWERGGGRASSPYYKSVLAEGMAQLGDVAGALHLVDEAIVQIERPGWEASRAGCFR
jgi:hypothetical protein